MNIPRPKTFVAMSGGVDSSVAAHLLLRAGHDVVGLHMSLWCAEKQGAGAQRRQCCNADDARDAEQVCQRLGIPFYVVNFRDAFQEQVVDYFCREYRSGRTPNPCIACNEWIKFGLLLRRIQALGGQYLATGHYARIVRTDGLHPRYRLLEGHDKTKDQSYFLYMLGQYELAHLIFPIGDMLKVQVRQEAAATGLEVARKADSVEVCFVADGNYRKFLEPRISRSEGDIVDMNGGLLGRHNGLAGYTIGQRARLARGSGEKLYVVGMDADTGRLVVGPEPAVYSRGLTATGTHWVAGDPPEGEVECTVRMRYRSPGTKALLKAGAGTAEVRFVEPQRAVAPGQAVVFYSGDEVLGGGTIDNHLEDRLVDGLPVAAP